jgi:mannose-6-phosphate isomerase
VESQTIARPDGYSPEDSPALGPLKFLPILKRLRWGGRRLGDFLRKPIGPCADYAESWEICDLGDDRSVVETGPWRDRDLHALIRDLPREMLGRHAGLDQFPLLVKFLDAHDRLSVQVHPDDAQAAAFAPGQRGKTEAWVIVWAEPGSQLFAGLKPGVDRSALRTALSEGTVEQCLNRLEVSAGDCFFIPAGTVHAIGAGILLVEVQQSSDLTFRLFDWDQMGADGQPRPLRIEQALVSIDFGRGPVSKITPSLVSAAGHRVEELVICPFFTIRRHFIASPVAIENDDRCHILVGLEGHCVCRENDESHVLAPGSTVLIPASGLPVQVVPQGSAVLLEVFWD